MWVQLGLATVGLGLVGLLGRKVDDTVGAAGTVNFRHVDSTQAFRHLSSTNSTHGSLCDHIQEEGLDGGAGEAVGYALVTLYIFIGIAIVCDEFFQPSLEAISDALKLSPDVAGATFLAAGSSAPELFTATADAFGNAASVGIGTIVGSAMFNILVIVALSCAVAAQSGASLDIDWRPVCRDALYYTASIVLLGVFFWDASIAWYESLIMVIVYMSYICFMGYNETVFGYCNPSQKQSRISDNDTAALEEAAIAVAGRSPRKNTIVPGDEVERLQEDTQQVSDDVQILEPESPLTPTSGNIEMVSNQKLLGSEPNTAATSDFEANKEDDEEEGFWHRFEFPSDEGFGSKLYYVLAFPFVALFTFTIPDCNQSFFTSKFEKVYWVSFIMSILWIGLLCHFMVEFSLALACILKVSPIMIGLLVLSVGTSVPDAIGSMIAAREGEANMAIANAIGSNVFDVLLGLGLPWFLASWLKNDPPGSPMPVSKSGILKYVIILMITVCIFAGILITNNWKMNKTVGLAMFFLYILFMIFTILDESGVF